MEAVYSYNVTLKDNVSLLTVPANLIHHNQVQLKGINALCPDEPKQLQIGYYVGNRVQIKTLDGQCMSSYTCMRVTGVISPLNVLDNGMPCHVRDLLPVVGLNTLESGNDSKLNPKCEIDDNQQCIQ